MEPAQPTNLGVQSLPDSEKKRIIQQQLVLLLHAHKCQRREQAGQIEECSLPHCRTMKNVLNHMAMCLENKCSVSHCTSSRQIISHWKHCSTDDCSLCGPLKSACQKQDAAMMLKGSDQNSGGLAKENGSEEQDKIICYLTQNKVNSLTVHSCKDWHQFVKKDLRDHLVHKLIKAIFPNNNPSQFEDGRLQCLIAYARKVEAEVFEKVNSREEYYHSLALKTYKIQKELTDKQKESAMRERLNNAMGALEITPNNYQFWEALMPTLEKLFMQIPESYPFREPVDLQTLQTTDYGDVIKTPMDLSTINGKLERGEYLTPWQYIDDVWLIFDNAWLYNRKFSKVFEYATKLAEIFEREITPIMLSLGYCCGRKYPFFPQVVYCASSQVCRIPRDAKYWSYVNRLPQYFQVSNSYAFCEKCFIEIPGDLIINLEQPQLIIKKQEFVPVRNTAIDFEGFVKCFECLKVMHKMCVLRLDETKFICKNCSNGKM